MNKHKWLSDDQVKTLNERHGWFKHGDAQSDVSRAFANDAVEAHERVRAAAPEMLEALKAAWNCILDLPGTQAQVEATELVYNAISKATGED